MATKKLKPSKNSSKKDLNKKNKTKSAAKSSVKRGKAPAKGKLVAPKAKKARPTQKETRGKVSSREEAKKKVVKKNAMKSESFLNENSLDKNTVDKSTVLENPPVISQPIAEGAKIEALSTPVRSPRRMIVREGKPPEVVPVVRADSSEVRSSQDDENTRDENAHNSSKVLSLSARVEPILEYSPPERKAEVITKEEIFTNSKPTQVIAPKAVVLPPTRIDAVELPKIPWNELPSYIPARARFVVASALKECQQAANMPLQFAKFMAQLPSALCGIDLALLLLAEGRTVEELASMCELGLERVRSSLTRAGARVEEQFATLCPEVYRKWKVQILASSVRTDALLEPHLVPKIDRNLQVMIGEMVIFAITTNKEQEESQEVTPEESVIH